MNLFFYFFVFILTVRGICPAVASRQKEEAEKQAQAAEGENTPNETGNEEISDYEDSTLLG